jgi:hypothetical protein
MHNRNLLSGLALGLGMSLGLMTTGASAAGFDGKSNLVCAAYHVAGCADGACVEGIPQTFDLPIFMYMDFKRKVVHGTNKNGEEVTSPIKNFEVTDNAIILQGIENHRGWTTGIDRQTGELTLSSTGADVSFIIFGNCTNR